MRKILVIATGAAALAWLTPEHASLAKVWSEVVFANQVVVDTGHPGSFELETVSPAKLAHVREYHWDMGAVPAIDDRPRQPKDRHRTLCGMCMDRSPGFDGLPSTLLRANELRTATRIDS